MIESLPWDFNRDGVVNIVVNIIDIVLVGQSFGESIPAPIDPNPDVNGDGVVNIQDIVLVGQHFGETYPPGAPPGDLWAIDPQYLPVLAMIYNFMEHSPDSDIGFLATRELIHRLMHSIRVSKAELLQNYPNPFNPDTYIPYQLAEDSHVTIRIYRSSGQLVRTMELGHRRSGVYVARGEAAHWDGINDSGERAASGIYYYTIQTDQYTATKKMILAQ